MRKALLPTFLLVLGAVILGSTVFREQLAEAASLFTNVIIGNAVSNPVPVQQGTAMVAGTVDTNGNIKVHEQPTANVDVTNKGPDAARAEPGTDGPGPLPEGGGDLARVERLRVAAGDQFDHRPEVGP